MAQKQTAGLPPEMDLEDTYTIRWAALDPTDGSDVAGVVISQAAMLVDQVSAGAPELLQVGPFMLVPGPES